ncbi:hypothetical protein GH733_000561 [Mirounga leonina]|nr:hypothetical protein GH733_000561 [Mirounga leonina]
MLGSDDPGGRSLYRSFKIHKDIRQRTLLFNHSRVYYRSYKVEQNPLLGFGAVAIAVLCSGFAGVYFEKVLKSSDTSLWVRNIQMYLSGIVVTLVGVYLSDGAEINEKGFFYVLASVGGLYTSVVVKYTDNIMKGFSAAAAIVLSTIASVMLFGLQITLTFALGTLLVCVSIYLYGLPRQDTTSIQQGEIASKERVGGVSGFATNACESSKVWSLAQCQGIKEMSETVNGNHEAEEGLNGFTEAAHRQRFSFTYQRGYRETQGQTSNILLPKTEKRKLVDTDCGTIQREAGHKLLLDGRSQIQQIHWKVETATKTDLGRMADPPSDRPQQLEQLQRGGRRRQKQGFHGIPLSLTEG